MRKKTELSVVLATFNEEDNIANCLKSIKNIADEMVVVDGSSEDDTRMIARSFGARVIKTKNRTMFHTNKQMAMDKAKGEWILQLDADEVVTKQLLKEINDLINTGSQYSAFFIPRKNYFLGKWLKKGGQYPDRVIRLFKKGKAKLPQKSVHEQMEVEGKTGILNGHLIHYTAPTFDRYIRNANRYTTLTAKNLKDKSVNISIINTLNYMIIKPYATFLSLFLRHKGILDGFEGFVFALFSGLHWQITYLKLWEKYYTDKKKIT